MRYGKLAAVALLPFLALAASASHAQIVNSGPINGLTTFTDTRTGLVWVDLNNFFNQSYNQMQATVTAAGFTVANVTQLHGLLDSLPLNSAGTLWDTYAPIMGSAPNRQLIWGAYVPQMSDVSWAYAFRGETAWTFAASTGTSLNAVPNGGSNVADMNIWAFKTAAAVPEPGSIALLTGMTLTGAAFLRRRKTAHEAA